MVYFHKFKEILHQLFQQNKKDNLIRLGVNDLNYEELKQQLIDKLDDIVDAIKNDKVIEIKKEKNNIKIFDVTRKRLN